jgi:hypothetical protein
MIKWPSARAPPARAAARAPCCSRVRQVGAALWNGRHPSGCWDPAAQPLPACGPASRHMAATHPSAAASPSPPPRRNAPAGTGKTTSARVLSTQAAVPLVYIPLESLMSKWYGESEGNLAKLFKVGGGFLPSKTPVGGEAGMQPRARHAAAALTSSKLRRCRARPAPLAWTAKPERQGARRLPHLPGRARLPCHQPRPGDPRGRGGGGRGGGGGGRRGGNGGSLAGSRGWSAL